MTKVRVGVEVETKIPRYWVAIDDQDVVESPAKKGSSNLEVDAEHYLGWWFAGNSGSPYKITLSAPADFKILAVGSQPVKRGIAQDRLQSSDTLRFFVVAK